MQQTEQTHTRATIRTRAADTYAMNERARATNDVRARRVRRGQGGAHMARGGDEQDSARWTDENVVEGVPKFVKMSG